MTDCESCGAQEILRIGIRLGLAYWRCNACGHCTIDLPGGLDEGFEGAQRRYFGDESLLLQKEPTVFEREILAERMRHVRRYIPAASRVLEVGPGSGFLGAMLKARGHQLELVEHSPALAKALSERLGIPVYAGELEEAQLPPASADAFCSFHVIEHVKDPLAHMRAGFQAVRPGGVGLVATPNAGSWQQSLFLLFSPNFDSAHLRVFSKASLTRYAEQAGWTVEASLTPEYTSGWPRLLSKAVRKLKGEDEEATAGKYAVASPRLEAIYIFVAMLSWPLRKMQTAVSGGNEILLVLRRSKA